MARSGTPRHCYHMVLGMFTPCPESFSCREVPQGRQCQIEYTHVVLPGGLPAAVRRVTAAGRGDAWGIGCIGADFVCD